MNNKKDYANNFKLVKESKVGQMTKRALAVVGVASVLSYGTVSISNWVIDDKNYDYTTDYDSYTNQLEDMLEIDIDRDLETELNSMEVMRKNIIEYQNVDEEKQKREILYKLIDEKQDFEQCALYIAKCSIANEYGGKAKEYKISCDTYEPVWYAVRENKEAIRLSNGKVVNLLNKIGESQRYNGDIIQRINNPDKWVGYLDDIGKEAGKVVVELSENKASAKK